MTQANAVADFLIGKVAADHGRSISNLQLQILLYYCQGWHLSAFDAPLFDDDIEAWVGGPVVNDVWDRFQDDSLAIEPSTVKGVKLPKLPQNAQALIEMVWDAYVTVPAWTLRDLARSEQPWKEARRDVTETEPSRTPLSRDTMHAFFGGLRDSLLEEASLQAITDPDDLEWLRQVTELHGRH